MCCEVPQDSLQVRAFLPTIPWIVPGKPALVASLAPECDNHNARDPNGEVGQVGVHHVNPDRTEDTPRCPREVPHKPPDSPFWSPVSSRHKDRETTSLTDGAWGTAPASGIPRSATTTNQWLPEHLFQNLPHTGPPGAWVQRGRETCLCPHQPLPQQHRAWPHCPTWRGSTNPTEMS